MKVVFNSLDRKEFISTVYDLNRVIISELTGSVIPQLTESELEYYSTLDKIEAIHDIDINISFKGNYVEFDDKKAECYSIILFQMKIDNEDFIERMKEDFIVEFEFNDYMKKIEEINGLIKQNRDVLEFSQAHYNKMMKFAETHESERKALEASMETLNEQMVLLTANMNKLSAERLKDIERIFDLEGIPYEFGTR